MSKRKTIPNDPMPVNNVVSMRPHRQVSDSVVAASKGRPAPRNNPFELPSFPKISLPRGGKRTQPMAQDQQIIEVNTWAVQNTYNGVFANGATFLGYPYLAELAQIPEYRKIVETTAMHMTRKFITLQATGADDKAKESKADKIKELTDDIENFKVRDVFRKSAEVDGYFGRSHLYIDLGEPASPSELKFPIGNGRDALSRIKVPVGTLKGFKVIEPVWTYPGNYNSNNPLTNDWYNPQSWFVLGKEMHCSRLLRMVGREVPDLLKPAYAFGGLALSQMAKPYVDNWLRTRQSVADVVWSFSTSGIMTDMQTTIQGQGEDLFARAELYNNLRNNRGLMILNKDSEEFFQINTPLGTLDKLQAQAQEHMASVSSIPLVFLLGITPSGLNASSEGEIRAFYDFIHAFQTKFFTEPLTRVLDFIQLNRYGYIDPEITFIFEPLWSMTEKELAEIDKTKAETDDLRINGGIISPLEARKAVANAPDTPYPGLDVTVIPIPPGEGGDPDDPTDDGAPPIGGEGLDPGKSPEGENDHPRIGGGSDDDDSPFAQDEWSESDHKRGQPDNAGQFGAGGGSGEASKPKVVEHYGSYAVEHNGEHVKNKLGNRKLFNDAKAAQKFADTYTGAEPEGGTKEKPKPLPSKSTISKGDKHKTVSTIQEYLDIAKKSERELSAEDKETIAHYTSPEYAVLNQALRSGGDMSPQTQKVVDNLDRIIGESKLSEPVTLFRGLKGKKVREQLDAMLPGDVMTDPGFVSTSMAKHVAGAQAHGAAKKATMIIRAPAGAQAAFPGEHSYNATPGAGGIKVDTAMEAILPRGSQFKLIGKHGATYEFELVPPTAAHDEAQWEESKHPRAPDGKFGSGGGSAASNPVATAKAVTSLANKPAGISNSYRAQLKEWLAHPDVSPEMKTKLKLKMIESYAAKAAQLTKNGDPKAKAVEQKALALMKALNQSSPGAVNIPINTKPAAPAPSDKPKHTVEESQGHPGKFIIKNPAGQVLGTSGGFGTNIPTMKFENQKAAETYAKFVDANADYAKQTAPTPPTKKTGGLADIVPGWAALSDNDKNSLKDLASFDGDGDAKHHYNNAKEKLTEKLQKSAPDLTAAKAAHIMAYTGSAYAKTNAELRDNSISEETHNHAVQLDEALKTLPKYAGVTTRGTTIPASQLTKWQPGKIIAEHGFMSTTKKEEPSFGGNVKLTVHGKNGRDVQKLSYHPGEQEVLFPSGTKFRVASRKESGGKTHITIEEV